MRLVSLAVESLSGVRLSLLQRDVCAPRWLACSWRRVTQYRDEMIELRNESQEECEQTLSTEQTVAYFDRTCMYPIKS